MEGSELSDPGLVEILRQLGSFAGNIPNLFACGYKEVAISEAKAHAGKGSTAGTKPGARSPVLLKLHDDARKLAELKRQQTAHAAHEAQQEAMQAATLASQALVPAKAQSASTLALATLKQTKGGLFSGMLSRSMSLDTSEPDQHAAQAQALTRSSSVKAATASRRSSSSGQDESAAVGDALWQSLGQGEGPLTTSRSLRQREQEQRQLRASLDDAGVVVVVAKGLDRVAEDDREGQESPTPREKQSKPAADTSQLQSSGGAVNASTGSLVTLRHDRRISGAGTAEMLAVPAALAHAKQRGGLQASLDSFSFGNAPGDGEEVASPHLPRTSALQSSVNSRLALTSDTTEPLPSSTSPTPMTQHSSSGLIAAARASGPLTRSLSIRQSVNQADLCEQENDRFRAASLAQQASKQAAEALQAPLQPVAPLSRGLVRQSSGAVPAPPGFLRTPGHSRGASLDGESGGDGRAEAGRGLSTWGSATLYMSNSMRRISHAGSGMAMMLPAAAAAAAEAPRPVRQESAAATAAAEVEAGGAAMLEVRAEGPAGLDPSFLDAAQQQAALAAELRKSISRMTGVDSGVDSGKSSTEISRPLSPSSSVKAMGVDGEADVLIIEETPQVLIGAHYPVLDAAADAAAQPRLLNLKAAAVAAAAAQPQALLAHATAKAAATAATVAAVQPAASSAVLPAGGLGSRQQSLDIGAAAPPRHAAAAPVPFPGPQQQAVLVEGMGKAALDILGRSDAGGGGAAAAKREASAALERSGSAQMSLAQVYQQTAKAEMNPLAAGLVKHRSGQVLARPSDPGGLPPPGPGMRPLQRSTTTPVNSTAFHTTPSPRLLNEEMPTQGPLSAAQPKPTPRPKPSASPAYAKVSPRQWQRLGLPAGPGAPLADPYINLQSYNNKYYESWFKEDAAAATNAEDEPASAASGEANAPAVAYTQQQHSQQQQSQQLQQSQQQQQKREARPQQERQLRRKTSNSASRDHNRERSGHQSDSSGAYASAEESSSSQQSYPGGRRTTLHSPPTFLRSPSGQVPTPQQQHQWQQQLQQGQQQWQQQQQQQGQQQRGHVASSPVPTPPPFLQSSNSRRQSGNHYQDNGQQEQQQKQQQQLQRQPSQAGGSRHAAAAAAVERMHEQRRSSFGRSQIVQPGYESQYEQDEEERAAYAAQQLPRRASMHGIADSRGYAPAHAPTAPPPPLAASGSFAPRSGGLSPSMSMQSAYSIGGASSNYASARTSLADSLQSSGSRVITAVDLARSRARMSRASDAGDDSRYSSFRRGSDAELGFANGADRSFAGRGSYGGADGGGFGVASGPAMDGDASPRSGELSPKQQAQVGRFGDLAEKRSPQHSATAASGHSGDVDAGSIAVAKEKHVQAQGSSRGSGYLSGDDMQLIVDRAKVLRASMADDASSEDGEWEEQ